MEDGAVVSIFSWAAEEVMVADDDGAVVSIFSWAAEEVMVADDDVQAS